MSCTSKSQHVFIMEPHVHGHHGPYLRWMAKSFAENGNETTILTLPESIQHPSLQDIGCGSPDAIDVVIANDGDYIKKHQKSSGGTALIRREMIYWWLFRNWYLKQVNKKKIDIIFLPYLDYCLYAIGLLGSPFGGTSWVGVAMRPSFHYREMGVITSKLAFQRVKKRLFWRLLKNKHLKYLLTIDEPLANYLQHQNGGSGKVMFMPEPYERGRKIGSNEAKKTLGIDFSRKVVLVYGSITSRKGVAELLRAITKPTCPQSVDVLLGGRITDEVLPIFDEHWVQALQRDGRLIVLDRYISEKDEEVLFSAADIVWLGYIGHYGASGVLVQAAMAGLPVIACKDGIIGWQTESHHLGVTVSPADIDSVVSSIRVLVENEKLRISYGKNGQRAFEKNTFDTAKSVLEKAISAQATDIQL